ncbi:MAG TPA: hypothetical protein VF590_11270, partial [Isosphaeraceae bacterium]
MRGPRLRLVRWLLGLVLVPPLLWAALLWVIPTGWAKALLVERLGRATGQAVALDDLRFRALGGVRLTGLRLGASAQDPDPWLRVESLRVDLNLAQLLMGRLRPREVEAAGLSLRIKRLRDGSLEFGDLLGGGAGAAPAAAPRDVAAARSPAPVAAAPAPAPVAADAAPGPGRDVLEFRLRDARVLVLDEPSATRLEFDGVEGRGTWEPGRAAIRELRGGLNGGAFELVARLDQGPDAPAFEGELRAEGVVLGVGMNALG